MNASSSAAMALVFTWLGMVLAISFLEAPLKFRAPHVTIPIGLGIGRMVFRALNAVEAVFAVALVVLVVAGDLPGRAVAALIAAMALLLVQLVAVRPLLTRRSDAVLAGQDPPRSRAHYAYIALETAKVAALITAGALLAAG
ncbi:hypothetical protein ABZ901_27115 [Actinacidiphila alni]|uniref:hypothetical protein n=1 Tax=Actinacidiphila alni TaxID=380248 RepID=UPI0033F4318E